MESLLIKKYAVVLGISGFFFPTATTVFYAALINKQQLQGGTTDFVCPLKPHLPRAGGKAVHLLALRVVCSTHVTEV